MVHGSRAHPRKAGHAVTRSLRVRPEAEEELLAAAEWYETRKPGLGAELVAAVDEAVEQICDAYSIFFVVDENAVEVVAIAHAKRSPGYWRGR